MRLQAIKLAGFKSFVDPTTVSFPGNLCAVVGPNGCGKSNIIDAVRWVMGESSAKTLRGESMADVIFNGSTSRKPVGQAIIELIFDNSEGRLKGEYGRYNEISIKRQVTRDGQSIYLLNGQRCRRKDITDVFLGTGLGPRSYSIIEQGMISTLIEARPEDLRAYLEEAAGISKYKERRRETERRISHTRDNLDRLGDLREELGRQLHRLERQAAAAERYSVLKGEEREANSQLLAMRWRAIDAEVRRRDDEIRRLEIDMEALVAEQRSLEANAEAERVALAEHNDAMNEVQKRFYDLGTEIARVEESLQFQRERGRELEENRRSVVTSRERVTEDLAGDRRKQVALEQNLEAVRTRHAEAVADAQARAETLAALELGIREWQVAYEAFSTRAAEPQKRAEAERARIEQLEASVQRQSERLAVLTREHEIAASDRTADELDPLRERLTRESATAEATLARQQELGDAIEAQRQNNQRANETLADLRSELQSAQGRQASLHALQQAALGQQEEQENTWLAGQGLAEHARLGASLQVQSPWEAAVEAVLGPTLQAVIVDDIERIDAALPEFEAGSLAFVARDASGSGDIEVGASLAGKVSSDAAVAALLAGVRVAPDLTAARAMIAGLAEGESVVTPEGFWLGKGWIRVSRDKDATAGVIKRQQEIDALEQRLAQLEDDVYTRTDVLNAGVAELKSLEIERDHLGMMLAEQQREVAETRATLSAREVHVEQVARQLERTSNDLAATGRQVDQDSEAIGAARVELQQALDLMERDTAESARLHAERDETREQLALRRRESDEARAAAHRVALELQSVESDLASNALAMARLETQEKDIDARQVALDAAIRENEAPQASLQESLTAQLAARLGVENELNEARRLSEAREARIREIEQQRANVDERVESVRTRSSSKRVEREADHVRRSTLAEQLTADGFEVAAVLETLPAEAGPAEWEEQLTRIGNRISRLGAINLAAIDEFRESSERKQYLDAQNDDLVSALTTLENAIRKIDAETRTRFKETFDKVNQKLQQLFPKLFGGGHAYLEMTGDDLLNTGVGLMARPPGKRNASISMLSGGEKALTAIALVFSIFNLNPAPFCLLDEVDAPLDDANVRRYSDMVKEMSRTVQFIYITHNKLAMEMAEQLMGVTMHEAGVSRLVSVDVEEAVAMAAV